MIVVDLNPMSRTSRTATITIVDDVTRRCRCCWNGVAAHRGHTGAARAALGRYDNARVLQAAETAVRTG